MINVVGWTHCKERYTYVRLSACPFCFCPFVPKGQTAIGPVGGTREIKKQNTSSFRCLSLASYLEKRWKLAHASDASMRASKGAPAVDPGEV